MPSERAKKWIGIAGFCLHLVIGGVMLFAGSIKIVGLSPAILFDPHGISQTIRMIGLGEVGTAILLLIPRTSSLGILLTSAFWGGAICFHMVQDDIEFLIPTALLLVSWLGAYMRNPATFSSFFDAPKPAIAEPAPPGASPP